MLPAQTFLSLSLLIFAPATLQRPLNTQQEAFYLKRKVTTEFHSSTGPCSPAAGPDLSSGQLLESERTRETGRDTPLPQTRSFRGRAPLQTEPSSSEVSCFYKKSLHSFLPWPGGSDDDSNNSTHQAHTE